MDEKQSIDAGTKAHFLDASQTLQIAHSGLGEAMKSGKNPHRCGLVKSAYIGSGLIRPNDSFQAGSR
jgi:hypothetical protein